MRKSIQFIFNLLLSVILIFIIINGLENKDLYIKFYKWTALVVSSGSMKPELAIGDIIIIEEFNDYNINDIVTYNVNNEYLVTHRVIEKDGNNYITKGDNNTSKDTEIIQKENIIGKVIYNSKILKIIYKYWIVIFLIIILILLFF